MFEMILERKTFTTSPNSGYTVRFAHPNASGISYIREPLDEMLTTGQKIKRRREKCHLYQLSK